MTTLAGPGGGAYVDGVGSSASFIGINGIAVDAANNVYVADTTSNRIRKMSSFGTVVSVTGSGLQSSMDGVGLSASFAGPLGLAISASKTLFVAESSGCRIRVVQTSGVVSTLAGGSGCGWADGAGAGARFGNLQGISIDSLSNLYVADQTNNRIRKVTSSGSATTVAGLSTASSVDGMGTTAGFNLPAGLGMSPAGVLFVADTFNHLIRMISSTGVVATIAGSGVSGFVDGMGTVAMFTQPMDVQLDTSGNLFIADAGNNAIRMIVSTGLVTTVAGSGLATWVDGLGTMANFFMPTKLSLDSGGNMYVSDNGNNRVRLLTRPGA